MYLKPILTIALMWVCLPNGWTQAQSYSLKEAQDHALENNYDALLASMDVTKSKQRVRETTAIGLPQVNGTVGYQNFIKQPVQLVPAEFFGGNAGEFEEVIFGTEQNASVDVTATQLLFDGSYFVGLQAARTYVLFSENQAKKSRIDVMEAVRQAYHTAIVAEENLKVLNKSKTNVNALVTETEALYQNGFAEESDVDQLRLAASRLNNNIENAERQVTIAKNMLKFQMGIGLSNDIALSDNLETLLGFKDNQDALNTDFNVTNHIDYQIAKTGRELNRLALKNAQAKGLPSLGGYFTWQENSFSNEFNFLGGDAQWFPTRVVGVQLNVPIFSSFQRRNQVQQARVDLEKTDVQLQQVESGLQLQAQTAQSNFNYALSTYNTEKDNLELAERIYQRTQTKFKEGLSSSFELSQVETQWLESQGSHINAMLQLLNAKSELDKALNDYK